jgi:hypothetical protein
MKEVRNYVHKMTDTPNNQPTISIDSRVYHINRIVSVICKAELVVSFISHCTNHDEVEIEDVLQIFRITTNSDIPFFDQYDKRMLAKLQNTLYNWIYKNSVEQTFSEYFKYPSEWRIMNEKRTDNKFSVVLKRDAFSNDRFEKYIQELEKPLDHAGRDNSFSKISVSDIFSSSDLYYLDYKTNEEKRISLNEELINYARNTFNPLRLNTEPKTFHEVQLDLNEMVQWAKEIDLNDTKRCLNNNWEGRIKDLVFSIPTTIGLVDQKTININGILHAVGALSVGKSTFITVCSYGLAKKGKRSTIFLNTTNDVLKSIDYLNQIGIKAVPLLSPNQISEHANQYISTLKSHHDIFENPHSFKYVYDSCILLNANLSLDDNLIDTRPPCSYLYKKVVNKNGKGVNETTICPLICSCPRYNNIRDLNDAQIIVTTINSAVQSYLPAPYASDRMIILEYIIRTCDIVFIDESDQIQSSLDSLFCKTVDIYGDSNIFYRATKNRELEYQESGDVPENEHIVDFLRGTSNVEYYTTNIANFLTVTIGVDKLFNHKIFDQLVKSQLLWRDLFEQAVGINSQSFEEIEKDPELKELYYQARKAFGNAFEGFQSDLLSGIVPTPNDTVSYSLRTIATNLVDESKLLSDLKSFASLNLCQLLKWGEGDNSTREDFSRLKGLYENWDKPLEEVVGRVIEKLRFIMDLYMLEHKLKFVLDKWEVVRSIDNKIVSGAKSPGSLKHEFAGVVPVLPIDVNYGFVINKEYNGRVHIKYKNLEGIGRWILLNFNKLYRDLDGVQINCVLLSGTSNMSSSPKYNIELPVGCLLRKPNIKKSKLLMYYPVPIVSKVSGAKGVNQIQLIADNLNNPKLSINGISYLSEIYERIPQGRKRVLFSLGSYDDCKIFSDRLNLYIKNSYNLVRTGELHGQGSKEIERGKIEDVVKYEIDALSIPLGVGRGYNIITEISDIMDFINDTKGGATGKSVAAIGAAFFVKRPYYIPNNIETMVAWLNSSYIKTINRYKNKEFRDFESFLSRVVGNLHKTRIEFENMYGYSSLSPSERERLLGDTIVDIFQLSCRLIRGNVDAEIHFIDSSFAPNSAEGEKRFDSVSTSMLIGWRNMLKDMIVNSNELSIKEINNELYQILLDGFEMLKLKERSN